MKRFLGWVLTLTLFFLALPATAQVVKFNAQTTTGAGSVVPVLTWCTELTASVGETCTNPGPATSCNATGDWTGTKAAAGTETLAAITASRTYNLTCTWPSGTTATLSWTPPTNNTDGSAYTDPDGYVISFGTSVTAMPQTKDVDSLTATSDTITGLTPGQWFFAIQARNMLGTLSDFSNTATKTLAAGNATRSIGITVNPQPNAPTGLVAED